jgi:ketosteroid isomerase-like protein
MDLSSLFKAERDTERAMSQENVELVVSLYDAVQRQDYESPFEVIDEDIVWDMSGFALPDMARLYRGHDGIREFWSKWLAAWETIEYKALAAEDHGDQVIVEVEQRNRGRASGVAVDFHYFQVSTVRNGKVIASCMAETRAKALEAAGLSE